MILNITDTVVKILHFSRLHFFNIMYPLRHLSDSLHQRHYMVSTNIMASSVGELNDPGIAMTISVAPLLLFTAVTTMDAKSSSGCVALVPFICLSNFSRYIIQKNGCSNNSYLFVQMLHRRWLRTSFTQLILSNVFKRRKIVFEPESLNLC